MYVDGEDRRVIAGAALGTGLVTLGLWALVGPVALVFAVAAALAIVMTVQFDHFRRAKEQATQNLRQTQALFSLSSMLETRKPLPPLTGWAATPELAAWVVALIRETEPRTVVELGSGASTVLIAYALEQQGGGRVVSLDHDAAYAEQTRARLRLHGLNDVAEVLDAPLRPLTLNGEARTWYDVGSLALPDTIDLLLVDGPPHASERQARYPALPVLADRLSDRAVIVLDDADRADERAIVAAWCERFGFEAEYADTIKGAAILRRGSHTPAA
jgi:predicted O-methyltransferase YrrM